MAKRGLAAVTVCSTAFVPLGRAQAKAFGCPDLPIAVIPHPFGIRTRTEVTELAAACVGDIVRLLCEPVTRVPDRSSEQGAAPRAAEVMDVPADIDAFSRLFYERHWGDGFPMVPPTVERVSRMLEQTRRSPQEVVARIPPAYGAATVELVAVNAVMAGCHPEYLPILLAAAEAVAEPQFNLQGIQATTNPAAVWVVLNGPAAKTLQLNSGGNCLGPGNWANATVGRAMRLILQNVGGGLPGEMDRATQGQPGKYAFCCAENEAASPWEPLHVERGFAPDSSTVTVVAPLGTLNMNSHAKDSGDLLRVIGDTMAFPCSSDYVYGGGPWLVLSPEHAQILKNDGLSKGEIKARLWQSSRLAVSRLSAKDFSRVQIGRRAELGDIAPDASVTITVRPEDISIIVAGGPGTHSVYMPVSGHSKSVTREIVMK